MANRCPCLVCSLIDLMLAREHCHRGPGAIGFYRLIPAVFLQSNPNTLEFTDAAEKALGFRDMAVSFSSDMCCFPCLPGSGTAGDELLSASPANAASTALPGPGTFLGRLLETGMHALSTACQGLAWSSPPSCLATTAFHCCD